MMCIHTVLNTEKSSYYKNFIKYPPISHFNLALRLYGIDPELMTGWWLKKNIVRVESPFSAVSYYRTFIGLTVLALLKECRNLTFGASEVAKFMGISGNISSLLGRTVEEASNVTVSVLKSAGNPLRIFSISNPFEGVTAVKFGLVDKFSLYRPMFVSLSREWWEVANSGREKYLLLDKFFRRFTLCGVRYAPVDVLLMSLVAGKFEGDRRVVISLSDYLLAFFGFSYSVWEEKLSEISDAKSAVAFIRKRNVRVKKAFGIMSEKLGIFERVSFVGRVKIPLQDYSFALPQKIEAVLSDEVFKF